MQPKTSLKPNDVLPPIMHVKPLAEGEVRIYRLIAADEDSATRTDEKTGQKLKNNPAKNLAPKTLVRNIETGDRVMIGNVTSEKYVEKGDGTSYRVGVTSPVKFSNGVVRLTKDDFATIQYMERHDGNADNPYRDRKKQAFFYKVDAKKKALIAQHDLMMKSDALLWVGTTATATELKGCAIALPEGLRLNPDQDIADLKTDLLRLADKNPIEVLKASTDNKSIAKIMVMECENFNIIMFDEEHREWFFNDSKVETITKVEIGTNKIEGLLEFFVNDKDGAKRYKQIENKLKKFLKAA